jgi:hypothetical protein
MFDTTSRYYAQPVLQYARSDGRMLSYAQPRILPQAESFTVLGTAAVMEGERLDLFAARTLGDPLLFWRIADANDALDPQELAVAGTLLTVPLASG